MIKKITIFSIVFLVSALFMILNINSKKENIIEAKIFESVRFSYVSMLINNINRENAEFRVTPLVAARNMNYIMLAGYLAYVEADKELNAQNASLSAAIRVAGYLYGGERETSWISHLEIENSPDKASSEFGNKIGEKVIAVAQNDNYLLTFNQGFSKTRVKPPTYEYSWVSTGRGEPGLEPHWGSLIPMIDANKKCISKSPILTEVENEASIMLENYSDKNAVHGDVLFWLAGIATETPAGQWMRILSNKLILDKDGDLIEKFKIATMAAVSNYDVSIQLWAEKYRHNLLRPESLWQKNGSNIVLPRETPNHPSYPSGHSGFASASGEIIKQFFGNTEITLSLPADLYSIAESRKWETVDEAISQAGNSRILSAFHYPMDITAGVELGRCVSSNVIAKFDERVVELLS